MFVKWSLGSNFSGGTSDATWQVRGNSSREKRVILFMEERPDETLSQNLRVGWKEGGRKRCVVCYYASYLSCCTVVFVYCLFAYWLTSSFSTPQPLTTPTPVITTLLSSSISASFAFKTVLLAVISPRGLSEVHEPILL